MFEENGSHQGSPTGGKIRPTGVRIIVALWVLGVAFNLSFSISTLRIGLGLLPSLADASVAEWFKLGVPAEMAISSLIFTLTLIQIGTIFGLWAGRKWSYRLALTLPILFIITSGSSAGLYSLAPVELGLLELADIANVIFAVFFLTIHWSYLRKPHVREYLGVQRDSPSQERGRQ